jgi:hypothetical protein
LTFEASWRKQRKKLRQKTKNFNSCGLKNSALEEGQTVGRAVPSSC